MAEPLLSLGNKLSGKQQTKKTLSLQPSAGSVARAWRTNSESQAGAHSQACLAEPLESGAIPENHTGEGQLLWERKQGPALLCASLHSGAGGVGGGSPETWDGAERGIKRPRRKQLRG